jgi:hypothetical protein
MRTLAIVVALIGLIVAGVWMTVRWADDEPLHVGPLPQVPDLIASSPRLAVNAGKATLTNVVASAPASSAAAGEPDAWALYQRALVSDNPAEVYAGLRAANECPGLLDGDLDELSAKLPQTDSNRARRAAAAKRYQQRCEGFVRHSLAFQGVQPLWDKLKVLKSPEYAAYTLSREILGATDEQRPGLKDKACQTLFSANSNPNILRELNLGLAALVKTPAQMNGDTARAVASAGIDLATCQLTQDCADSSPALMQCATTGVCDNPTAPLQQGSLSNADWAWAQALGRKVVDSVKSGSCGQLY